MKKLFIYSLLLVLSLLYLSCSKDSNPVNNTLSDKPTVEIISPANNSVVSDSTTIEVKATDDKGITRVEIFVDDSLVTKLLTAPFKYIWNALSLKDSTIHTIYARAFDTDSNMVATKLVTVTNRILYQGNMVLVQGGTFTMGDTIYATPLHSVTLSNFYISKTEVTQRQYKAVMGTNPSWFPSIGDNKPVETVTWYDCISFCNKLSIQQGKTPCYSISGNTSPSDWTSGTIDCNFTAKGYRLATEAEWEYAARGGNKSVGYTYSGSNTVDDVAWYYSNSVNKTHTVGTKTANELGINDMSGNVFEWCWDWYSTFTSSSQTNPTGASSGSYRVLRGGSWNSFDYNCRSSVRGDADPGRGSNGGFRLVQGQ